MRCFDATSNSLTRVVIAHIASVTVNDVVVSCLNLAALDSRRWVRKLDRVVTRLARVARGHDTDVISLRRLESCLSRLVRRPRVTVTSLVGVVSCLGTLVTRH